MNTINNNDTIPSDIILYQQYIDARCIQGSTYQYHLTEFESNYEQKKYSYTLLGLFDYLVSEEKLSKEYCSHFEIYLNDSYTAGSMDNISYIKLSTALNFFLTKTTYSTDIVKKGVVDYEENNFLILSGKSSREDALLMDIAKKGCAIWLNSIGNICIRFSTDTEHKEYTITQANRVLSNFMSLYIEFIKNDPDSDGATKKHYISINSLLLIQDEVLNTGEPREFYQVDGLWYRNLFKPSRLLRLNQQPQVVPLNIFYLIAHLVQYDITRFFVFINWLAAFFQTLKKSQVAMLFKGKQGAGKGTLFKVIEELFGQTYCKQINGDSLKSNYLGSFIENTLFLNFDEISYKTIGKSSFGGFLKAIITNDEVTSEKKGINMAKPTKAYAQTILFSNVDNPVEIEQSDRRFTVFTTAGNIKETNFFGHGTFQSFEQAINSEIEDFAMYLKLFQVDTTQANSVFETPEKMLMVNNTANQLQWLVNAIVMNDWQYFEALKRTNVVLYNIFMKQLTKYRVFQKHLILVYTTLYPLDQHIQSAKTLIKHLEQIAPEVFGEHNLYKTNGDKYYKLSVEDIVDMPVKHHVNQQIPYQGYVQTLY